MQTNRTIDAFETTLQATHQWIRDYADNLGQLHPPLAYRCLRTALHAIRDRLPVSEAVALAAQLPMLLRGAYYEGWVPGHTPHAMRTPDELYDRVSKELSGGLAAAPRDVMLAAFELLNQHIDEGEIRKVRHLLPEELRRIWPEPLPHIARPPIEQPGTA
ncbi:DUF2267 domain-containing protein [Sandaracinus amylolyticus]|uniref:DUF2267 domain-containing protein n=1 Tax=Sandaracinus amylolyticus TaxID=927083 RepID=A0A0F6VZP9_9BACT|nr:DUF2267 domain-containing protein [Sandaracinus amylolyticus]AKF03768.1 hypothetical protein DB32_000917 [Sandaracinus amylolyticus]